MLCRAGPRRPSLAFAAGFEGPQTRPGDARELTGYRLEPGASAQVVFGVRASGAMPASVRAVWVDYSALQRRYQVRFPRSLRFCPGDTPDQSCGAALRG